MRPKRQIAKPMRPTKAWAVFTWDGRMLFAYARETRVQVEAWCAREFGEYVQRVEIRPVGGRHGK